MSYRAGPSYQVSDNSSSSSSSDEEYKKDPTPDFEIEMLNTQLQWSNLILNQQTMAQQYYYMQSQNPSLWGGSVSGHAVINRGREAGATLLRNDYFSENSTFESKFRRRFRMSRDIFLRIRRELKQHSSIWKKTYNAARTPGLSSYQKMCASIQFLAYGTAADSFDQYFRIAESTLLDYVKHFCKDIVTVFRPNYLRKPNAEDIGRLLQVAEARGFPGMLGSLDCMHWEWKNCPTANAGAYRGRNKGCTMILEAVASYDTWIWHAFFGLPGTNNDVNVLHKSNLFADLTNGTSLPASFSIKNKNYTVGYFLADGIYPKWSTLVQTFRVPHGEKEKYFVKKQESYRKDVERAFGILQARFAIVRGAARLWNKHVLHDVMSACIIMHNMIVEEERSGYVNNYVFDDSPPPINIEHDESLPIVPPIEVMRDVRNSAFVKFLGRHRDLMNQGEHNELRRRLVAHLWDYHGQRENEE